MIEQLHTTDEDELNIIVRGLESQAGELEASAKKVKQNALALGFAALVTAGTTAALDYVPEAWPYEKDEFATLFVVFGIGLAEEYFRGAWYQIKARRKRLLAKQLQAEDNSLPIY